MENSQISDNNCERKGPFHEGKAGMPEFLATHLTAVAQDHQDGVFSAETGRGGKNRRPAATIVGQSSFERMLSTSEVK